MRALLRWALLGTGVLLVAFVSASASATSGFSVIEENGAWWFAGPDGRRFLSKGVDCVGPSVSREEYDPAKPQYSSEYHLGETFGTWRDRTLGRLRSWGFNTIGGWSDERLTGAAKDPVSTPVLHIGVQMAAPWVDMWVPDYEERARELAIKLTDPYRGEPGVLGYFLDNEFGWGDEYFIGIALGWPGDSPGKKLLVEEMKKTYSGDLAAFAADFATAAKGWDDLAPDVKMARKPGRGHRAIDAWMYVVARRYYELFSRAVREADPGKLILGDRYRQYCPQAVARAARGVLDVVSTNFEARTTDGWISPVYFDTIHELSGLPVIIGEFYATARQNRSGNRNSGGEFTLVDTQEERAAAAEAQVGDFAAFPFVVGWHWFQFWDEPTFGRGDGEDYNMGLVDIYDEPYEVFVKAHARANAAADGIHSASRRSGDSREPLAVARQKGLRADGDLGEWDKAEPVPRALTHAPASLAPFADFFLAWDEDALWIAVRAYDFTVPSPVETERHDGATWGELHRIRIVAGEIEVKAATGYGHQSEGSKDAPRTVLYAAPPAKGTMSAAIASHVDQWHYVWEVAIPTEALGRRKLRKGESIHIEMTIENRGDYEAMSLGRDGRGIDIVLESEGTSEGT